MATALTKIGLFGSINVLRRMKNCKFPITSRYCGNVCNITGFNGQSLYMAQVIRFMNNGQRNIHQSKASTSVEEFSDSDDEEIPCSQLSKRDLSNFWRRKMRTIHSHFDVNKDGVISYDDFKLLTEKFARLGHLSLESKKGFEHLMKEIWEMQWGDTSPYNSIGVDRFLEHMYHILEDKSLRKNYHKFLPYLFKAVDKDGSGEISVEEFKIFFKCLGLKNDDAAVSFSHIDINGDGKISLKEFVKLGRDYVFTQDQKRPSKHFWGPLVDS